MKHDDRQFLKIINDIAREQGFVLPALDKNSSPSSDVVSTWATFLQACVRQGITLSDTRWERIVVNQRRRTSVFSLTAGPGGEVARADDPEDFRVGLQLLMGMLFSDTDTAVDD